MMQRAVSAGTARPTSATKAMSPPADATVPQRAAFDGLLRFCAGQDIGITSQVLSGYAGTGKTWLAAHLVRAACAMGLSVAVCAPTHKAVAVLSTKLEEFGDAQPRIATVHALLGLKLREGSEGKMLLELDRFDKGTYFEDYDIVFIDEASMVGPSLLRYIAQFQGAGKPRVLYIGDPGQLAPVEDTPLQRNDGQMDLDVDDRGRELPVFDLAIPRHNLTEIVRQKATGRPHPIVQFAQEIRRYIEGEVGGVFHPEAVQEYVTAHADVFGGAVRMAGADAMSEGATALRLRRPEKDIRVVAWRNRVVDQHNRVIHHGLASRYNPSLADGPSSSAPFWSGETLVAREALYGFPINIEMHLAEDEVWEKALLPKPTLTEDGAHAGGRGQRGPAILVQNNTEMIVTDCEPMVHPYLRIPSWRIRTRMPDGDPIEFFMANDPREHQRMTREAWTAYRSPKRRSAEGFRRAWAVTRACVPVMHAYAVTAHKAQGSTFHYALVDLADLHGMVRTSGADDYHRALYVAVTRASERVWLCL